MPTFCRTSNISQEILEDYPEITAVHPAADLVPMPSAEDFAILLEDIRAHGLLHSLLLTEDGELVDGRSRLLACHELQKDPHFKTLPPGSDPVMRSVTENLARRHLTAGQRAAVGAKVKDYYAREAKQRQREHGGTAPGKTLVGNLTPVKDQGKARDMAGKAVGVDGSSIDRFIFVEETAPDLAEAVKNGGQSLHAAHKQARERKEQQEDSRSQEKTATVVAADGRTAEVPRPKKALFNRTNGNVDWARWTWNPVTGCNHGCKFCYAREIAHKASMRESYPFGFSPAFLEHRLAAPKNMPVPKADKDPREGRVFVGSMADLFGKWVPDAWIDAVFDACRAAPQWEYLFLTKWPARYARRPLLEKAWYGASVVQQRDVARVERDMRAFEAGGRVKWVSLEPMLEPIRFNDLSWCDLLVIGAQTRTVQPGGIVVDAFGPEFRWVSDIERQCREACVPVYMKPNLANDPGMQWLREQPKQRAI